MKKNFLSQESLALVVLVVLSLSMIGCDKLTKSSSIAQKTDPCRDVPMFVWGEKGNPRPEINNLINCYDWEIKARQ